MPEDFIKVAILSLIEGVTEFLPVSSTGHLIVSKAILDFDTVGAAFEIFIQFGAVIAVIAYYRRTLYAQFRRLAHSAETRRFWLMIGVACAPAAALGYLFDGQIASLLFSPPVVAIALIIGGLVFIALERSPRYGADGAEGDAQTTSISLRQALIVGLIQSLALIPGASRSGTSIVGGMVAGMNRRQATEFSFILAIPLLGAATLYKFASVAISLSADQVALMLLGAALAALFSWLTIDWLLKFVSKHSFVVFGYYRILAGCLILIAVGNGII